MRKLIIWYNPNKKIYYYRFIRDLFDKYYVGYINQYNHEVVLIIDNLYVIEYKPSFKSKVIKRTIRFLKNIDNK